MKVQLPVVNHASGTTGNLIFQTYRGRTYARAFPAIFHYPDTKKQQDCQASFFDIQRIWLPIYKELTKNIAPMQRKNKNPFNKLTSAVYHIFNPYQRKKYKRIPQNWGLDPDNRIHANIVSPDIRVDKEKVTLSFYMQRPTIGVSVPISETLVLLFNQRQQNMYFTTIPLQGDLNTIDFKNTNNWELTDDICAYIALAGREWLGNFNLVPL